MKKTIILISVVFLVSGYSPVFADKPDKARCPQARKTPAAPPNYLKLENPLEVNAKRLKKGEVLYMDKAKPMQCLHCHGARGDGTGELGLQANPPARNFTCLETMKNISDGQMFWAIKNGVKGTAMPAYSELADWEIWVLIHYVRQFGK
ncbi:MAG: cytochrome c [Nitrospinae bacterium]|nr:cytochrome c [Nitrospinota bacterium]MZH05794.1 cytochrome c [Nitrospinota bacterium]MZH14096.1 cytochrome c [Nitrospinota bacterium]